MGRINLKSHPSIRRMSWRSERGMMLGLSSASFARLLEDSTISTPRSLNQRTTMRACSVGLLTRSRRCSRWRFNSPIASAQRGISTGARCGRCCGRGPAGPAFADSASVGLASVELTSAGSTSAGLTSAGLTFAGSASAGGRGLSPNATSQFTTSPWWKRTPLAVKLVDAHGSKIGQLLPQPSA